MSEQKCFLHIVIIYKNLWNTYCNFSLHIITWARTAPRMAVGNSCRGRTHSSARNVNASTHGQASSQHRASASNNYLFSCLFLFYMFLPKMPFAHLCLRHAGHVHMPNVVQKCHCGGAGRGKQGGDQKDHWRGDQHLKYFQQIFMPKIFCKRLSPDHFILY